MKSEKRKGVIENLTPGLDEYSLIDKRNSRDMRRKTDGPRNKVRKGLLE